MPTGYTAPVQDGTVTTLEQFALVCARAFGATILMRDDPPDAPIPVFKPSTYHPDAMRKAKAELQALRAMAPIDAQRACQQDHARALARWKERSWEDARQRARYNAMLELVREWESPTSDHAKFKAFMVDQLTESLAFDCGGQHNPFPRLLRWPEWLQEQIDAKLWAIGYHQKRYQEEVGLVAGRNTWMRCLRESLTA